MQKTIDVRHTDIANFPYALAIQKNLERAEKIRRETPHLTVNCQQCGSYALADDAEQSPYTDKEIALGFAESRLVECISCKNSFYITHTDKGWE